jgi:hypothetical protein
MAAQNRAMEEIMELLEFEALYNSSTEEFGKPEGEGLCAILALVGTINMQLNSYTKIRTRKGRNDIADVIEKVLIPSTQKYTLPEYTHIDQGAQERMYYRRNIPLSIWNKQYRCSDRQWTRKWNEEDGCMFQAQQQ